MEAAQEMPGDVACRGTWKQPTSDLETALVCYEGLTKEKAAHQALGRRCFSWDRKAAQEWLGKRSSRLWGLGQVGCSLLSTWIKDVIAYYGSLGQKGQQPRWDFVQLKSDSVDDVQCCGWRKVIWKGVRKRCCSRRGLGSNGKYSRGKSTGKTVFLDVELKNSSTRGPRNSFHTPKC